MVQVYKIMNDIDIMVNKEKLHNVAIYRNTRSLFQNLQEKV